MSDIPIRSWVWQEAVTLPPLGATPPVFVERQPSEIPSWTRSVSVFLPDSDPVGPRSSGEVHSGSCHTHTILERARSGTGLQHDGIIGNDHSGWQQEGGRPS